MQIAGVFIFAGFSDFFPLRPLTPHNFPGGFRFYFPTQAAAIKGSWGAKAGTMIG